MKCAGIVNLGDLMFRHPATIGGTIIMVLGWMLLLGGGVSDSAFAGRGIVNFHTLWIATGMILTGCTFIVAGLIAQGVHTFVNGMEQMLHLQSATVRKDSPTKEVAPTTAARTVDPAEALRRQMMERGFKT